MIEIRQILALSYRAGDLVGLAGNFPMAGSRAYGRGAS